MSSLKQYFPYISRLAQTSMIIEDFTASEPSSQLYHEMT